MCSESEVTEDDGNFLKCINFQLDIVQELQFVNNLLTLIADTSYASTGGRISSSSMTSSVMLFILALLLSRR